jgi:hypothetical protein
MMAELGMRSFTEEEQSQPNEPGKLASAESETPWTAGFTQPRCSLKRQNALYFEVYGQAKNLASQQLSLSAGRRTLEGYFA